MAAPTQAREVGAHELLGLQQGSGPRVGGGQAGVTGPMSMPAESIGYCRAQPLDPVSLSAAHPVSFQGHFWVSQG